jgi:hypothetical protein
MELDSSQYSDFGTVIAKLHPRFGRLLCSNGGDLQIQDREAFFPATLAEFQKDREWLSNWTAWGQPLF